MRFLFAPIASPGYFFPAIGVALNLRHLQHDVAFVSEKRFHRILERKKLECSNALRQIAITTVCCGCHSPRAAARVVPSMQFAWPRWQ